MPSKDALRGHKKKLTDVTLREIRKARVTKDDAETHLATLCIAALEAGYSYSQVAYAALSDKGSMHYFVHRFKQRLERADKPNSYNFPRPAKVDG